MPLDAAALPLDDTMPLEATPLEAMPIDATPPEAATFSSTYLPETRAWIRESRARRRRAAPVRWVTLGVLAVTLGALAIADAANGIVLPVYFWVGGSIVLAGLIAGALLRRTPWGLTSLLLPVAIGLIAFGNSPASMHDGAGRTIAAPISVNELQSQYRLAFGQSTLDLRSIPTARCPPDGRHHPGQWAGAAAAAEDSQCVCPRERAFRRCARRPHGASQRTE